MKRFTFATLLFLTAAPASALAQDLPARPGIEQLNVNKAKLAIEGYDPVAYFPEAGGKAKKGKKDITLTHRGVVYRFANKENQARFAANPVRYEPAYGGWCAWAMADDDRVSINPKAFLIQDGELLLFYDGLLADTRKRWGKGDTKQLKIDADKFWLAHTGRADRDLSRLNLQKGLGVGGYDLVALRQGELKAGESKFGYTYRGVKYRFATAANAKKFRADPSSFEPALGAWDATALAAGKRVAGGAQFALVHDKRVYLFASDEAKAAFEKDAKTLLPKAAAAYRKK